MADIKPILLVPFLYGDKQKPLIGYLDTKNKRMFDVSGKVLNNDYESILSALYTPPTMNKNDFYATAQNIKDLADFKWNNNGKF